MRGFDELWLDREDLRQIQAVVAAMVKRVVAGQSPCGATNWPTLRGARLTLSGVGERVAPDAVRAKYSRIDPQTPGEIALVHFPRTPETSELFAESPAEMGKRLTSLLSHEVSHARQVQLGTDAVTPALREAEELGRKAKAGTSYADYMAYVAHPIEAAAHATQLVVEIIVESESRLDEGPFRAACRSTWLFHHLRDEPLWEPGSGPLRAALFDRVWVLLVDLAWYQYDRLV